MHICNSSVKFYWKTIQKWQNRARSHAISSSDFSFKISILRVYGYYFLLLHSVYVGDRVTHHEKKEESNVGLSFLYYYDYCSILQYLRVVENFSQKMQNSWKWNESIEITDKGYTYDFGTFQFDAFSTVWKVIQVNDAFRGQNIPLQTKSFLFSVYLEHIGIRIHYLGI